MHGLRGEQAARPVYSTDSPEPSSTKTRTPDDPASAPRGSDAPRPRARRKLSGHRREPAGGLRAARRGRRDRRGGLAPRRRHRPRRGRRALQGRGCHRTDGGRDPRALQPYGPHRSVQRGPHRGGRRTRGLRDRRPRPRGRRRSTTTPRGRRRGRRRRVRGGGRATAGPVVDRGAASPPVCHGQVGGEPRRPGSGSGRLEPVDHRHGVAPAGPRAARRERRHPGRHRHRARRRSRADRARRRAASSCRISRSRSSSANGRFRPMRDLRQHPAGLVETGSRDLEAVLAGLFARGIRRVLVEGGPTLASAVVAAGLADEYLVYLAPKLIGGPRSRSATSGSARSTRPANCASSPSRRSAQTS